MTDFQSLLAGGNAWLFLPSAILLGALHGLEPGHSKTMMAAFIVAVRGTLTQAVLLGLAATLSHTAIVWLIALGGLYFGQRWSAEASEPWMQLISAVLIVGVAAWMLWRTARNQAACFHDHVDHDHDHKHDHDHDHDHGLGQGVATAAVAASAGDDAHAREHAQQIQRRFAGREVTTGQIVMFGLTGGLIPCPASITVLLLCLQLKKIALGAALVLGFSLGLALTMVASGVVAALGVKHLSRHVGSGRFSELAAKAPYLSAGLILLVGLFGGWQALHALA